MSEGSRKIAIARLYTDEAGESHFIDELVEAHDANFAPPAPSMYVSTPQEAKASLFLLLPAGYDSPLHPAPRRQIMTLVSGELAVTTSDGGVRRFLPGETVLVEDTSGKGHGTRSVGGESVVAVVQL
ncbi:hypothetical protein [Longispora albida]|uniref:hypothetical protein n=1 Tax=Longispora albida TaxID=203523 RepID=UPI000382ED46|nr:hypothetical protein [Longispora albida]